jgi:hypothetical protein
MMSNGLQPWVREESQVVRQIFISLWFSMEKPLKLREFVYFQLEVREQEKVGNTWFKAMLLISLVLKHHYWLNIFRTRRQIFTIYEAQFHKSHIS